jgi:hypothetical protein
LAVQRIGMWQETARLFRRARRRPVRVILAALLLAGAATALRAQKPHSFEARVVLRVTEGDIVTGAKTPRPARRLREHVLDVAFSGPRLLEVIRKHDLYPRTMAKDWSRALETMREDIEVDVWRNYFVEERTSEDPARSARIAISFTGSSPDLAEAVVGELAALIIDDAQRARAAGARLAADRAAADVADARMELATRRSEIVSARFALMNATPAEAALLRVRIQDTERTLPKIEERLAQLMPKATAAALTAAVEEAHKGLTFEAIDAPRAARPRASRPLGLAIFGGIVFLLLLPLSALWFGAFDPRIYDAGDIERLGLSVLGGLPRFSDDNLGALATRRDTLKP